MDIYKQRLVDAIIKNLTKNASKDVKPILHIIYGGKSTATMLQKQKMNERFYKLQVERNKRV